MGTTRIVLRRQLSYEHGLDRASTTQTVSAASEVQKKEVSGTRWAVLLDNVRSALNAGSILRSADGFGFTHAYFCGITPTPDNEAVTKTSLGAEDSVPWSYHKDAVKLIKGLKGEGWKISGLEEDERAESIAIAVSADPERTSPAAQEVLIVGNEVTGVDPGLLDLCDNVYYIPMRGEKRSFNVAIAFGIAAYAINVRTLER